MAKEPCFWSYSKRYCGRDLLKHRWLAAQTKNNWRPWQSIR